MQVMRFSSRLLTARGCYPGELNLIAGLQAKLQPDR